MKKWVCVGKKCIDKTEKMNRYVVRLIVVLLFMFLMDGIYLGVVTKDIYAAQILRVQKSIMNIDWLPALLSYLIMALVIVFLIIPNAHNDMDILKYGALGGLAMYGVYNMTNMATFDAWGWSTALMDMSWGIILVILTTYVGKYSIMWLQELRR